MLLFISVKAQDRFKLFDWDKEPQTFEELTDALVKNASGDSAKVLAVYTWITNNVSYDYGVYMSGEPIRYQSPEIVFRRKRTTCTGYSNLMVAMLTRAGIPAYTVEGFTQDFVLGLDSTKLSSDHAWVAFSMNGNWELADPTWDAGSIGIMKITEKAEVKKTFWQRVRSFKLKYLFRRKKSKSANSKTVKTTKVSYKMGFTRNPTLNYIFKDPNEFLKSHLPNSAHIQMKTAPVSVKQFCDSAHSLGDMRYSKNGGFDYNRVNDTYYGLEIPDRLLWISDSSLNYHYLNHGDKALNAHNYLAHFYGGRTNVRHLLEKYSSIADTVIIHGNMAAKINREEWKRRRLQFMNSFQREKKMNQAQLIQVNYIRSHLARNRDVYRKGRDRITQKELVAMTNWESKVYGRYGFIAPDSAPRGYDTIPKAKVMVERLNAYRDTIKRLQEQEKLEGPNYLNNLSQSFYFARSSMYHDAMLLYEGQFLNEWKITEKDAQVLDSLTQLTNFMRDSINSFMGSRKSYNYIVKLDQEIRKQVPIWNVLEKKDSVLIAADYLKYANFMVVDLMKTEREIIDYRLSRSAEIDQALKDFYTFEGRYLGQDMKSLSYLKTMRQAYLTKMMNNKYNRSIKVYTIIVNNAKNWKNTYKQKLKNLDQYQ